MYMRVLCNYNFGIWETNLDLDNERFRDQSSAFNFALMFVYFITSKERKELVKKITRSVDCVENPYNYLLITLLITSLQCPKCAP